MNKLAIFLSDLIAKSQIKTRKIWSSALDGKCLFITNRLGSDGAANVTEYQAKVIEEKFNKNCIIVTGRKTNLWSGKTPTHIIPELAIPHKSSIKFIRGMKNSQIEKNILNEVISISTQLEEVIHEKQISLIIAQNVNSLCYNISAAIAIINTSTKLSLPVIHQCFDFFWEHTSRNRNIFEGLKNDLYVANIYNTIGTWNQLNWSWTFHTNSFKELSEAMGVPKNISYILSTPVFEEEDAKTPNIKFSDEICLGKRFKIIYGIHSSNTLEYKIVIPAKISRKKRIFETIENILEIFCIQKPLSNLRITVTGSLYDMENEDGFAILNNQFNKILSKASLIIEMKELSYIEFQFLGGTARFTNKEFNIIDILQDNDIICYGSDIETDCLTIFEACLQKKIIWITPWVGPYDNIFNDLFNSFIFSPITGIPNQKMLFPFETYSNQITNFNSLSVKKKRSKKLFLKQLENIISCQKRKGFNRKFEYEKEVEFLHQLLGKKKKMLVVLIGGNPNAGKSVFCTELANKLKAKKIKVGIISLDDYSIPIELAPNKKYEPCSIEIGKLIIDIQALIKNNLIFRKEYQHAQKGKANIPLYDLDILLIEGVFALIKNQKSADNYNYDQLQSLADCRFQFIGNKNFLMAAIKEDIKRNLNLFKRHDRIINKIEQAQIAQKYVNSI